SMKYFQASDSLPATGRFQLMHNNAVAMAPSLLVLTSEGAKGNAEIEGVEGFRAARRVGASERARDRTARRRVEHLRVPLHYRAGTEKAYLGWIRRFIIFNGKRHPETTGELEIGAFLSSLATEAKVAASTQNQALAALLFLYQEVLGRELRWLGDLVHAK